MDQDKYREAETAAIKANQLAGEVLNGYWDGLLNFERACEGELADDPDCPADDGWDWIEGAFVSIEDDGRLFIGFGGPNIWVTADDRMAGAWWGRAIYCDPPSQAHADALAAIRDYISELEG